MLGQSGRAADLVNWTAEAYNDLQREKDGKWKWLRRGFTLDVILNVASYAYGAATDLTTAAAIDRFRGWDLDDREPPLVYLATSGKATEIEMAIATWPNFRFQFVRATHTPAYPKQISEDSNAHLYVGPTPDATYRVTGNFWASNQTLAVDTDIPEMPANYHMLIPYRALMKYGYNIVAAEVLARVEAEAVPMFEALSLNQAYSRFSFSTAGPLA